MDPVTQHCAFLQYILELVDSDFIQLEEDAKGNTDLSIRTAQTKKEMMKNVKELLSWVQSPIYHPDHVVGRIIMEEQGKSSKLIHSSQTKPQKDVKMKKKK